MSVKKVLRSQQPLLLSTQQQCFTTIIACPVHMIMGKLLQSTLVTLARRCRAKPLHGVLKVPAISSVGAPPNSSHELAVSR